MSFRSMLNKTCDIEEQTLTTANGDGEQLQTWQPLYEGVRCRLRSRAVSERRYGPVNYQKATHALYTAAKKFPKKAVLRVLCEGKYYDVVGRLDLGGADKYLCLYLERCE